MAAIRTGKSDPVIVARAIDFGREHAEIVEKAIISELEGERDEQIICRGLSALAQMAKVSFQVARIAANCFATVIDSKLSVATLEFTIGKIKEVATSRYGTEARELLLKLLSSKNDVINIAAHVALAELITQGRCLSMLISEHLVGGTNLSVAAALATLPMKLTPAQGRSIMRAIEEAAMALEALMSILTHEDHARLAGRIARTLQSRDPAHMPRQLGALYYLAANRWLCDDRRIKRELVKLRRLTRHPARQFLAHALVTLE